MFIAPFHSYFSTLALLAEVAKIKIEELVLLKQKKARRSRGLSSYFFYLLLKYFTLLSVFSFLIIDWDTNQGNTYTDQC